MSAPIVTLTTDFGLADGYVAAMKGVLLSRCPAARLVDVSHEIAPGAIAAAAFVLGQAAFHFPAGTVHLVVVDPGVGSARRGLACEIDGHRFVCPDNGLLHWAARGRSVRAFALERPERWRAEPSAVFHGRDVFAPVAAFLACGGELAELGGELAGDSLVELALPPPARAGEGSSATVVHVDRFGNLITDLRVDASLAGRARVEIADRTVPFARTYSDVEPGELVALRGSSGLLEVACNGGSAARVLGAAVGLVIILRTSP